MNYRHAYHAGNFADVVKHATLALLLERLKAKDAPFCVIDTHAGIGRYDLSSAEAQKTGEFRDGVQRLLESDPQALPPELEPYLAVVRGLNQGRTPLRWYPGSPRLALDLLRPDDRLMLLELHPEDARTLADLFAGDGRVSVHNVDGYMGLRAFLPPKPRRGLVLVDPPFEQKDEFARLARGVRQAHRRWATGQFLLWYPIKGRAPVAAFHGDLKSAGIARILIAELLLRPATDPERLNGCGLVLINPPWRMDATLSALLPKLARLFGAARGAGARVEWLVAEDAAP
ncbi:MAG TPA: 23S rRNA (adenine(2030)-N(6))-methyltransferase RlmJ [Alphaproteobacteria bacterium]|nr:23S rRNA (adenine(2030)-N(6))-methyltransferase RlmJ [Alphaproteobacteria bacterium]